MRIQHEIRIQQSWSGYISKPVEALSRSSISYHGKPFLEKEVRKESSSGTNFLSQLLIELERQVRNSNSTDKSAKANSTAKAKAAKTIGEDT